MEIFQVTMEKLGMNSKKGTAILVVFSITLPILLMVTVMYQNSSFSLFEGFAKAKLLGGKAQNITDFGFDHALNPQPDSSKNDTNSTVSISNYNQNSTSGFFEEFPKTNVLEEKSQNLTELNGSNSSSNSKLHNFENHENVTKAKLIGSRNDSFASSNNESSQTTSQKQLFDKLLAPGFNEGSCLSRFQSYLYRKSSLTKPSGFLISKLRSYENLHRRCGPGSRSYNRASRLWIKSRHVNRTTTRCKYIVWTSTNGLGNRMLSMASVFLYAVLTNRVFLVDFGAEMEGLFCEPFLNSSWKLPVNFPYRKKYGNLQTYESLLSNEKARQFSPSFLYLNLERGNDKLFNCDNSQAVLQKISVLILRTDQYFVPSLFMTPFFNEELNKMFPDKENVFHQLGYYLFHPSNEAWGLITRFYQAYLENANQRIGLQIRVFKREITLFQIIMDQILSCASKHNLLPEVDERNSIAKASLSKNRTSKAVLVASLSSNYTENLRNLYWTKPTVTGEVVGVYQPSHEEFQKFNNKHLMKALAEIYLLSMCDVLVTTGQSTFGYVAQSLGGLKPWILYKTVGKKVPKRPCQPALHTEPCFHYPPKYDCKTRTKVDVNSVFSYLRPCEDWSFGVKMVNDHA